MLVLGDIHELGDGPASVWVVKNKLQFEWCSMMLFNNELCSGLTPEFIDDKRNELFDLSWAKNIGSLPPEWNHCVGYDQPRPDAKLVHFTQGIPFHEETGDGEYVQEWRDELEYCVSSVSWEEMMGNSVHAKYVRARNVSKCS